MASAGESHPSASLLHYSDPEAEESYAPISYVHSPRPLRDLPALTLFILLSLATFALGLTALARRNPSFPRSGDFVYDPSSSACVLLLSNPISSALPSPSSLVWTLVVTLLLSAPLGLTLLYLLKHFAKQAVYAAVPFFVLVPTFLNVYWFAACQISLGCRSSFPLAYRILILVFVFILISIVLWIIISNWHRIELTIHVICLASAALEANLGLLVALPALTIGLLAYFTPIVVFLVFARYNGKVVPLAEKESEFQCRWKEEGWVPAYFALAVVTMIWSAATMLEAQVYIISGTIAQWYFSKEESRPQRSMRNALRNAFGPSCGTVCFSGMVFGAVRAVRAIVDSAKHDENARGLMNLVLQCCAKFLMSACEFVNKFTVNFAAITGEGYCSASRMTYELLKRNFLSAVFVETVSSRVLGGIIFVVSALYAIVVYAILNAVSAGGVKVYHGAVLAWLLLVVVLGYFVHVLDNVIDTVYVCYAIDRDKGDVCKQHVHEVYVQLPLSRTRTNQLLV